jgi:hypothetical protein
LKLLLDQNLSPTTAQFLNDIGLEAYDSRGEILHPVLADFFSRFPESKLSGCIAVVERHRYRVRKLK